MGNCCFKDQVIKQESNINKLTKNSYIDYSTQKYIFEDNENTYQNDQDKINHDNQKEKKNNYQNESLNQLKTCQRNDQEKCNDLTPLVSNIQKQQLSQNRQSAHIKSNKSSFMIKNEVASSIHKSKQSQSLQELQKFISKELELQNIFKNLLLPKIYLINLIIPTKSIQQNVEIICELPQNDSYLIKKLKQNFDENRLQRAPLNYSHIIQCFLKDYYIIVQSQLNWYQGQNNSFKFCQFIFENESIIYSRYFDQESQSYLNVYSFLNQNDFQNSVITGQVAKSSSGLIAELFCDIVQFDEQNELIFEESFDFNFDQFKSIINKSLEEHNLNCILLQLIDICLLFDELKIFYNQFDQYNVGFIYHNSKLFVKLRKIFTLKKDYQQYISRSKFINEYINVYDKQHILYYEICSVLELVQQLIQDENNILQEIITEFVSNKEFKQNGVCQKQVFEFFKMYFGDQVLKHYPAINMYKLQLYMKDLKFMYAQNFMYYDDNQLSIIMQVYFIKEYEENKKNYLFCNMNMFIIWVLGANEENLAQIDEYLTNFSQKYSQKCMQVLSYVLKFFMLTDYKPSIIEQILKLMLNYALKNDQVNILGYLIDNLSYFYLKRNQFSEVIEILDIIASDIKQDPSRYQKDVKKQVILIRFLVYLLQKKDFDTIQKQYLKYISFLSLEKEEEIQQKIIIDTCNYLIPTYYLEILIFLIQKDYYKSQNIIDKIYEEKDNLQNNEHFIEYKNESFFLLFAQQICTFFNQESKYSTRFNQERLAVINKINYPQIKSICELFLQFRLLDLNSSNNKFIQEEESYKIFNYLKQNNSVEQVDSYQQKLFPDLYDLIFKFTNQQLIDYSKQLNDQTQTKLSSEVIVDEKIEDILDQKNQQQREKYKQAVENVSKLLYIDIAPLLLDDLGFTKEYLVQPFSNKFKLEIKYENINQALIRNNTEIYFENDINLNEFQDFLERIQSVIELKMKYIETDNYANLFLAELNKNRNILEDQYQDKYGEDFIYLSFGKFLNFLVNHNYQLSVSKNEQYIQKIIKYQVKDQKYQNRYLLFAFISIQQFYEMLDFVVSINQCRYVNRYLNKIIHIDFKNLIVYTTDSQLNLFKLQSMYAQNMTQIPEQKVKEILSQIFKITLMLFENKYYICKFNLDCFSLHESKSYKNKFYLKYNDIRSITNNLALSVSELQNNNRIIGLKYYDNEFSVSEQFYLKLSILQICQQMVDMMLNQYNRINQVEIDYQKNLDKLRNIYSIELIEFFEKSKSRTDNFTKQGLYEDFQTLFSDWNSTEKKQLIVLTEMEQNILNEKIQVHTDQIEQQEIFQAYLHTYMSRYQVEDVLKRIKKVKSPSKQQKFTEFVQQQCLVYVQNEHLMAISRILYLNNTQIDENLLSNLYFHSYHPSKLVNQKISRNVESFISYHVEQYFLRSNKIDHYFQYQNFQFQNSLQQQADLNLIEKKNYLSYLNVIQELYKQAKPESVKSNIKYWQYLTNEVLVLNNIAQQQQLDINQVTKSNFFYNMLIRLSLPSLVNYNFLELLKSISNKINLNSQDWRDQAYEDRKFNSYQYTMQLNLDKLILYKLDKNVKQFSQQATELPYKNFSCSLFRQQLACMNMVLNGQEVDQNLKNLENLYKYKINFEVKDSSLVKEPQIYLKCYANNIAELLINRNQKLIEYFSQTDLTPNLQKCQYFNEEEQYFLQFQKYKNQSTFNLFQGGEEQIVIIQSEQDNICQNQKILPPAQTNMQISSKQIQENFCNQNTQLETQNCKQEIPFIENNTLKQQEIEITKFLKQEEQETQEYKLMFENNQTVNEDEKMKELTIQVFKDQDLKSNNFNQNQLDKQTQSYKILNEQEIILNKQKKLDQKQNDTIQQAGLSIGKYLQSEQQYNLEIKNTTIDFQINRKFNDDEDEEEEEKEQFQNQTKSSNQNNLLNQQIQNKESNFSLIQNLILKQSNDLLKIGHLGKGGQAGVEFYYDFKQKKQFALKNFENQYEYLQEKKNHIKIGLYHSDIKPQNMVLYLDQNELSIQHQFGFQLADFEYIQLKFIDFASCSDDPDYYYQYQTPKYKYYGYQNQNLDFKQILFAETYSACKSVYYLLDEELQQKMQITSYDSQLQEFSEENNFLFFLQIFLGDNQVNRKLSKVGISADELISLAEKHLGKIDELNKGFKCDFINVLQVGQWQNISDIESISNSSSTEYQIFQAFAFINKLEDIFNENNMLSQNIDYKIQFTNTLLQYVDIITLYKSFTEEQLNFILKILLQKSTTALSKEQYQQFIQCACFLYCHSEKDYYYKCIEAIKETYNDIINQNEKSAQLQEIVYEVFLSIIKRVKVDPLELIERIYLLEIEIQQQHSLLYEFLITYIVETQKEFDEQTAFIMLNILEQLKSSQNLNIFQLKLFNHTYLYFLHLTIKDDHKEYCQNFYHYKQICRELNLMLEQDTIIFYNYHLAKIDFIEQEYVALDLNKFSSSISNSDRKLDKKLKSMTQNQSLEIINKLHFKGVGFIKKIFI
ncbi:hypothetical protein ABPG74_010502 [Tetrahymena malaccensis]